MASWIVHLRIAENLLRTKTHWDPGYFAIGNIAPDSGLPDAAWETFDPPPEVLHFKMEGDRRWRMADLSFYRKHLGQQQAMGLNSKEIAFRWGYFCHLVVDNLWRDEVARPTHERLRDEFAADPKFIWTVKRDWYGLDFEYVRQHPNFLFWNEFQTTDFEMDGLAFLPQINIQMRLEYIREYYQRSDDEIEQWLASKPGIYLSQEEMDEFVDRSSGRLSTIIDQLHDGAVYAPDQVSVLTGPVV